MYYVVLAYTTLSIDFDALDTLLSLRLSGWSNELFNIPNVYTLLFGRGVGGKDILGAFAIESYYINIMIQFGLIGLIMFLCFIFTILFKLKIKVVTINMFKDELPRRKQRSIFKSNERPPGRGINHSSIKKFVVAMFLANAIYSLVESTFFTLGNISSIYLWINIGIFLNLRYQIIPKKLI